MPTAQVLNRISNWGHFTTFVPYPTFTWDFVISCDHSHLNSRANSSPGPGTAAALKHVYSPSNRTSTQHQITFPCPVQSLLMAWRDTDSSRVNTCKTNKAADSTQKSCQEWFWPSVCHHLPSRRPQLLLLGQVCCDKPLVTHPGGTLSNGQLTVMPHIMFIMTPKLETPGILLHWCSCWAAFTCTQARMFLLLLFGFSPWHSHSVSPMQGSQQAQGTS